MEENIMRAIVWLFGLCVAEWGAYMANWYYIAGGAVIMVSIALWRPSPEIPDDARWARARSEEAKDAD
jgi:hypothetical protein